MDGDGPAEQGRAEADAQRARRAATLRSWCEEARVPGAAPDLSDLAAHLVAAGRAGGTVRAVLEARARAGVGIPAIGDYTGLRDDARRLRAWEDDAAGTGTRALLGARRADALRRRLVARRSQVAAALVVHGGGLRGVRRERREGIHLTLEQREHVFALLCWTPAPLVDRRGRAAERGQAAVADLLDLAAARWPGASGAAGAALGRVAPSTTRSHTA